MVRDVEYPAAVMDCPWDAPLSRAGTSNCVRFPRAGFGVSGMLGMERGELANNGQKRFISDIASFELKPLFLIGSSITAVCFAVTIAAVHVMRYEPGFALLNNQRHDHRYERDYEQLWCSGDENDSSHDNEIGNDHDQQQQQQQQQNSNTITNNNEGRSTATATTTTTTSHDIDEEDLNTTKTLRLISLFSVLAAVTASTALILLSILDTVRHRTLHQLFLQICFSGMAVQAAGTAVVYANEVLGFVMYLWNRGQWSHDWGGRSVTVRILYVPSSSLYTIEYLNTTDWLLMSGQCIVIYCVDIGRNLPLRHFSCGHGGWAGFYVSPCSYLGMDYCVSGCYLFMVVWRLLFG